MAKTSSSSGSSRKDWDLLWPAATAQTTANSNSKIQSQQQQGGTQDRMGAKSDHQLCIITNALTGGVQPMMGSSAHMLPMPLRNMYPKAQSDTHVCTRAASWSCLAR